MVGLAKSSLLFVENQPVQSKESKRSFVALVETANGKKN